MLMIRPGINSHSSTEGCFSTANDRNKMAGARKRFVFRALRIVFIWCRDVARSYLNERKVKIYSCTVVPHRKL